MTDVVNFFTSNGLFSRESFEKEWNAVTEKVKFVFEKIAVAFIFIGLLILYATRKIGTASPLDPFYKERVFKNKMHCNTHNFGKLSDLFLYLDYWLHPIKIDIDKAKLQGLSPRKEEVYPKFIGEGACFGNTLVFLKKWLNNEPLEAIIEEFEGGSSLSGALYQEKYFNLINVDYNDDLKNRLVAYIQKGDYSTDAFEKEKIEWQKQKLEKALCLLDGLQNYLKMSKDPRKDEFVETLISWCQKEANTRISGQIKATLREIAEVFAKNNLIEKAVLNAAHEEAGLCIEEFCYTNTTPEAILRSIPTLGSGAYELSFPNYNLIGSLQGYHTTGFTIDTKRRCLILDSNIALGYDNQNELQATIGRLFTHYNGLDYSNNLAGERPSSGQKVIHFFQERAHPPATLDSKYSLRKITILETDTDLLA